MDHSTLNRWVLVYAPLFERRLRAFRKPHCGSICIDETYSRAGSARYTMDNSVFQRTPYRLPCRQVGCRPSAQALWPVGLMSWR